MPLIKKGAEASLFLEDFSQTMYPSKNDKVLIKHRIPKDYRAEKLDQKLRSSRTSLEAKILADAKEAGVPTPLVYQIDKLGTRIIMEYVNGETVKDILEDLDSKSRKNLCEKIGKQIARIHDYGIIHGDLTTSNMIETEKNQIYFIDFGLGEYDPSVEARGTDIHLLHRTLKSTHFKVAEEAYREILQGYKKEMGKSAEEVIKRVQNIERRGRYISKEERK